MTCATGSWRWRAARGVYVPLRDPRHRPSTDAIAPAPTLRPGRSRSAAGTPLRARRVIVATGGLSVPATGSDGAGLAIARRLGHAVHATYPALTPLVADPPVHARAVRRVADRARCARAGATRPTGGVAAASSSPTAATAGRPCSTSRIARCGRGGAASAQPLLVQWTAPTRARWHEALRHGDGLVVSRLRERLPQRLAGLPRAARQASRSTARSPTLRREERTRSSSGCVATRCRGPATKAIARPKSPAAASRSPRSIRARSRAAASPGSSSAAKSSTPSARSAATTSRGPGPPDVSLDWGRDGKLVLTTDGLTSSVETRLVRRVLSFGLSALLRLCASAPLRPCASALLPFCSFLPSPIYRTVGYLMPSCSR